MKYDIQYRYDVINFLSEIYYGKKAKYLEIGVEYPEQCFDKIIAGSKTSVDPAKVNSNTHIDYQMTSDQFFEKLKNGETEFPVDHKWDIIFIDGLHLAEQVYRDIQNAVKHCSGFILLHDCAPSNFWNAHSDYEYFCENRHEWNGSTWKAFYKYRTETDRLTYTINTDYGIGFIDTRSKGKPIDFDNTWFEFGKFKANMKTDLGLISIDEFKRKHVVILDNWWNWRFENENGFDYRP